MWGSATGQLILSIWTLWHNTGWSRWIVWIGAYACIAAWQGLFQDLYWDVRVTPEHDTPWSISRKVMFTHIPNVTITLTYLTLFENRLIFVLLQALALVGASIFMRFPAWYETATINAATTSQLGPLLRCSGFLTDDPTPYATQRAEVRSARR